MQVKRLILVLTVLMGSWLVWTTGLVAQNDENEPTAVEVLYFRAAVQADGVRLDWATATEQNSAGFIIQRSSNGSSFVTLDGIGFIPSTGDVATGALYSAVDTTAVPGQTYTYKLVEIETNSSQNEKGTVTITFNPQPTATPIIINPGNPSPQPGSTSAPPSIPAPSATATTAVSTPGTSQPTATPRTTTPQPTPEDDPDTPTGSQPTTAFQALPTAVPRLDQAFTGSSPGATGGADSDVVFAQEEPSPAAYPGPDATASDLPTGDSPYPPGQEPPTDAAPEDPTPYPDSLPGGAVPTLAIIGSSDPYPPESSNTVAPAPSAEVIRGRILLWAGFLIALFIFLSGVVGAIVLYRRRPA